MPRVAAYHNSVVKHLPGLDQLAKGDPAGIWSDGGASASVVDEEMANLEATIAAAINQMRQNLTARVSGVAATQGRDSIVEFMREGRFAVASLDGELHVVFDIPAQTGPDAASAIKLTELMAHALAEAKKNRDQGMIAAITAAIRTMAGQGMAQPVEAPVPAMGTRLAGRMIR